MREISSFPFTISALGEVFRKLIHEKSMSLMENYKRNAVRKDCLYKTTGNVSYDEYYPKKAKHIIDEIDSILGAYYRIDEESLDFIVSFDIKFRMGEEND